MTFLSLELLEERRKAGLSPLGGPLPQDRFDRIVGRDAPESMHSTHRCRELHELLSASWNHPGDTRLWRRMFDLIGRDVPLAHLHIAADYVHRIESDPLKILERCDIYEDIMRAAAAPR